MSLQDAKNFVTGHKTDLGNSMRITKIHTDFGGKLTFLGKFTDLVSNFFRSDLEP